MRMGDLQLLESFTFGKLVYDFITKMSLILVSFFAPFQGILIVLFTLIALDTITGILASIKQRCKITSVKLSRTITKTMMYLFTIVLVQIISKHVKINENIPLTAMVSSFIILTEFQSILENLNRLTKQNFLVVLIDKISLITKGRLIATTQVPQKKKRKKRKKKSNIIAINTQLEKKKTEEKN